jgi:hypothetical protein
MVVNVVLTGYNHMQYCDQKIKEKYGPGDGSFFRANLKQGVKEVELSVTDGAEWTVKYDREPAKVNDILLQYRKHFHIGTWSRHGCIHLP